MSYSNSINFHTLNYATQNLLKRHDRRYYNHEPFQNQSIEYNPNKSESLNHIAKSFNIKKQPSLQRSKNLEANKKLKNVKKRIISLDISKDSSKQKSQITKHWSQNQSINVVKGQGYDLNSRYYHKQHYKTLIVPIQNKPSKKVVPIDFQYQLKQANKNNIKQNMNDWIKNKREDILSRVSEQIKLKSEFQKFLP